MVDRREDAGLRCPDNVICTGRHNGDVLISTLLFTAQITSGSFSVGEFFWY